MAARTSDAGLEPGLTTDAIEERQVVAARRHYLEKRNMAYWLLEIERRLRYRERRFSSVGERA